MTTNKKMKSNILYELNNITDSDNMTTIQKNIIHESTCISNKEALKDKIHEIHNYLRNNGAGYGMPALKLLNILYGLKKIEECGLLDDNEDFHMPDFCLFSNLLKLAEEDNGERLAELIYGDILSYIFESELNYILYYEIPRTLRGSVLVHIIKEIENITIIEKTCNVLLSGKIYEYFIGRDESAISELGAYFTDRHIVDYILQKLNPTINEDGTIHSMIDMFGGSGGFTTGYIQHINELNKKSIHKINWKQQIKNIFHFDMNEDVVKSAGLEFFTLTGALPPKDNLKYKNSFTDEFENKKFHYILTNPPYGGDKSSKSESQNKLEKVKEYIKKELLTIKDDDELRNRRLDQLKKIESQEKKDKKDLDKSKVSVPSCSARIQRFAKQNNLKGNDKESCSLMLMMDTLEECGTAIGVLKEGVFFNKTYKDVRKCLIEKYNVREVISVPQDQFENTSTKTSILIFDNTVEKTTEVKFIELFVERCEEDKFGEFLGEIILVENKGDIVGIRDTFISCASKEELLSNPICSLNGKDYGKKELIVGSDYELIKLGNICEFMPKSKRNASFGKTDGLYNFYTSSDKVQKCDVADYHEECLIIGDGGVANIKMDNVFSCSDHNHIIKTKHNSYIFYLLSGKIELLSDGFSGSVLKNLSKDYLKNLHIPIPKSPEKMREWVSKISKPYDEKNVKQQKIKELELFVQNRIREISEKEECDESELGSVCKFIGGKKRNTTEGKSRGLYPLFSSSLNVDYWVDYYDYNQECIIINTINGSGKFNLQYSNKFCATSNTIIFNTENINLTLYIYYYGLMHMDIINNLANGSTKKKMGKSEISKFKLKIPKNKQHITDLEATFQELETLQNDVKLAEESYKQLIHDLSHEAIPTLEYQKEEK